MVSGTITKLLNLFNTFLMVPDTITDTKKTRLFRFEKSKGTRYISIHRGSTLVGAKC